MTNETKKEIIRLARMGQTAEQIAAQLGGTSAVQDVQTVKAVQRVMDNAKL